MLKYEIDLDNVQIILGVCFIERMNNPYLYYSTRVLRSELNFPEY